MLIKNYVHFTLAVLYMRISYGMKLPNKNNHVSTYVSKYIENETSTGIKGENFSSFSSHWRIRREVTPVLNLTCDRLTDGNSSNPSPLQCYQCQSNTLDEKPQCDTRLFRYVRHSEKFQMKQRCNSNDGYFCIKSVFRKFGERITQRGCYGKTIEDPKGRKLVTADNFRQGCFSYTSRGYIVTSCFCSNSLCNTSSKRMLPPSIPNLLVPFTALLIIFSQLQR